MAFYRRRKHTPPPNILILKVSHDRYYRPDLINDHHSNREKKRRVPHMVGLHVNNFDLHDHSTSSFGWRHSSDKSRRISQAPDVVYRNTFLEEIPREKTEKNPQHRSSSACLEVNNSFPYFLPEPSLSKHSTHQDRTIYDYISESIRNIEQQRNSKQENFSSRVQRPQNEDSTFRRILSERKFSAKTSSSRTSSTTQTSLFNFDLKSPESFVNYLNHSRLLQSPTFNQSSFILSEN